MVLGCRSRVLCWVFFCCCWLWFVVSVVSFVEKLFQLVSNLQVDFSCSSRFVFRGFFSYFVPCGFRFFLGGVGLC